MKKLSLTLVLPLIGNIIASQMKMDGKFLYFAYGSNMLAQRIHINNPTAVRYGIGKLKDYHLDFVTYSRRWKGASATIIPKAGSYVWGALWKIDLIDMENLDRQEGVSHNIYFPLTVDVKTPTGETVKCRVYIQTARIPNPVQLEELPDDRKPSAVYINTMLKGAKESELPEEYQNFLRKISHNGYEGEVDIGTQLNLK